jgi:hypothetical protein
LSVANSSALNLGSSNYTIECWFYAPSAPTANDGIFTKGNTTSVGSEAWSLEFVNSSGNVGFGVGAYNSFASYLLSSSTAATLNAWNHIAVVRNGTSHTMYLNGASVATATASYTVTSAGSLYIGTGWYAPSTRDFIGYISNARLVIGTAVYTSAFTPPTAPLTAITNTSLLLNYTNAGIYDATSKNDLETVGNAQISTAQSKWGGSSMAFDGTGDYLNAASSAAFTFGTGSFTIEGWHYLTASATSTKYLFDQRVSGQGFFPALYISSGSYNVYINSTIPINAGTVVANTWVHWALVKNSGTSTTTLYINGTSVGSFSDSNNYSSTAQFRIGSEFTASALYDWQGYMQDIRITKGYARYTSNFTPPTAAFPTL